MKNMEEKNKQQPGTWTDLDGPEVEIDIYQEGLNETSIKTPELEYSEGLIAMYNTFRDQVYDPQSVLYPSCGLFLFIK